MFETVFQIGNALAATGWLLLVFAPRWRYGTRLVCPIVIPLLLATIYAILLVSHWGESGGGFGSLDEVRRVFQSPALLLAGWLHYLAFDLFIGAWETRDALASRIPRAALIPCLALTFVLGPVGLALYLVVRASFTKRIGVGEAA